MDLGFLVDQINEKSGARAPMKIAQGLALLGEKITIYAYPEAKDTEVEDKLKELKVEIVYVQNPKTRLGKFLTASNLLKPLREHNHDLISCHSSYPLFFAAARSGKPIIYTYYGTQLTAFDRHMEKETGLRNSWVKQQKLKLADQIILRLEKLRIHKAVRVLGISKSTVLEAARMYQRKIDYIYLGADLDDKAKLNRSEKKTLLLLSVSRLTPYKGFHRVLAAYKNIKRSFPELKLALVGTSQDTAYLNYLKSKADRDVEIILSPSDQVLINYYQKCSLYVSGTTWEGFGLPFLEAALLGKPVIGFRNTSLPEVVEDGKTGFLASSQEEFEEKIKLLCQDLSLRIKMGKEGVKFAQGFSWAKTSLEYQSYFSKFLERGSK